MRYETKIASALAALLTLVSCTDGGAAPISSANSTTTELPADQAAIVGEPFNIGPTTYTPADTTLYDEVGLAGIFGADSAAQLTASGEAYVATGVTAAHKTLPMPSYIEVTALDTGRTILVRINDRGPMTNDRLIDLSEGAARQLGIDGKTISGVRVRRVNPPENDKAVLRSGQAASTRMDTPESLLKVLRAKLAKQVPPPAIVATVSEAKAVAAAPTVADKDVNPSKTEAASKAKAIGSYYVQVAAFASRSNADALAKKLGAQVAPGDGGKFFRVRFGPFTSQTEATSAQADARKRGYPQARLVREKL